MGGSMLRRGGAAASDENFKLVYSAKVFNNGTIDNYIL